MQHWMRGIALVMITTVSPLEGALAAMGTIPSQIYPRDQFFEALDSGDRIEIKPTVGDQEALVVWRHKVDEQLYLLKPHGVWDQTSNRVNGIRAMYEYSIMSSLQGMQVCPRVMPPVWVAGPDQDDRIYLPIEWVEGKTLAELIPDLDVNNMYPYFLKFAKQVANMHAAGVVHRDLHLDNVLISKDRARLWLIDFTEATSERRGSLDNGYRGRAEFIAPEVLNNRAASSDPKADVWTMGVGLFWMATGELPVAPECVGYCSEAYSNAEAYHRETAMRDRLIRPEWEHYWNLSTSTAWIRDVLMMMLHPNPEQRATAQEVVAYLQGCMPPEVSSYPISQVFTQPPCQFNSAISAF